MPPPPCKAEGSDAEAWRVATGICRRLEETGAGVLGANVRGTHLVLTVGREFGQRLLADSASLHQSTEDILSLMLEETGTPTVSVEIFFGDSLIVSGKVLDSGERRINTPRGDHSQGKGRR